MRRARAERSELAGVLSVEGGVGYPGAVARATKKSWTSPSPLIKKRCAARCARSWWRKRRRNTCGAWPSTTTPGSRPRCGARSSTSAGPALLVPEAHGGLGLGIVDAVVVQEEMGRAVFPGPFFSSAIVATLAARALGLDERLAALAAGTRTRNGRDRRSRSRRPDRPHPCARDRSGLALQARRCEADGDGRAHRRLGARSRAHARRLADVPRRATRAVRRGRAVARHHPEVRAPRVRQHPRHCSSVRPATTPRSGAGSPTTRRCCSRPSSSV